MVPSSVAVPENVWLSPGVTVTGCGAVGGTTEPGELIATAGAWPCSVTFQARSTVSSEELPPVSCASAWAVQLSSVGTVISLDQVVVVALGTSGAMLMVL